MPSSSSSLNTSSGITTTPSGVRHIPSSTRADGSTRKEIRVRPGYKPPEDVEVYKNRTAEAWKTRDVGTGVPGSEELKPDNGREGHEPNSKNAKRREARRKAKASAEAIAETRTEIGVDVVAVNGELPPNCSSQATSSENLDPSRKETRRGELQPVAPPDPIAERDKQVRNLKKKLRQARELREKKDHGENLLPEQFEKVIKISELIRQLDGLGFDADGGPTRD
jgi:partner of Y14 and mago